MKKSKQQLEINKTGWPPNLLQDDNRKLSEWFASRLDARQVVRKVCNEILRERIEREKTPHLSQVFTES